MVVGSAFVAGHSASRAAFLTTAMCSDVADILTPMSNSHAKMKRAIVVQKRGTLKGGAVAPPLFGAVELLVNSWPAISEDRNLPRTMRGRQEASRN